MQADAEVSCRDVSGELAALVDDRSSATLAPELAHHLGSCLRCQAELAQYRKLRRAMLSLRSETMRADAVHLEEVLDLVRPPATVHKIHGTSRRKAYIGGIAAAATAGAAGAIVIASKLSRHRLAS